MSLARQITQATDAAPRVGEALRRKAAGSSTAARLRNLRMAVRCSIEELVGTAVAGVQYFLYLRPDVVRNTSPLEWLVRQRIVLEVHQLHSTAHLAIETLKHHLVTAQVIFAVGSEHPGQQCSRPLGTDRADDSLIVRLVTVDGSQGPCVSADRMP